MDLLFIMKFIMKSPTWNPTNRFLIIFECSLDDNEILEAYDILRRKHIYKCLFIRLCDGFLLGYSWNFKKSTSRCENLISLTPFNISVEKVDDYFISKIPKETEICSINISPAREPSSESIRSVQEAIANLLGLKLIQNKLKKVYGDELFFNDSVGSIINDLNNHMLDIGVITCEHGIKRELVEKTVFYYFAENIWLFPRRKILKEWNIFFPIRYISYFCLSIITIIIVLVPLLTLHSRFLNDAIEMSLLNRTIFAFSLLTTASGKLLSKSISLRLLMFIAIIHGFYLNLVYTSLISSIVTNPPREAKIRTFEDFLKSHYQMNFYEGLFGHLEQKGFKGLQEAMKQKWIKPSSDAFYSEVVNVIKSQKYGIVVNSRATKVITNYNEGEKLKLFHDFYYECFLVRKGFPYLDKINEILMWTFEAGIFGKWLNMDMATLPHVAIPSATYEATKLKLQDFTGAFIILGVGIVISVGIFIAEIIIMYVVKR
ncbi:uncharacterized protein LOC112906848 [Agrilus planipennis]|uniref:Uncharacterized protein LOC112906848 n=1 Tax=Agrilus planipennis TaxID=224129 RepID=A0A7F5RNQ9_AGRPL|nr:uncharacterized protein LOC112906848 [Agrilus planipennis]